MKILRKQLVTTFSLNILLFTLVYFLAVYFFIGKNITNMAKTQNVINMEILSALDRYVGEEPRDITLLEDAFEIARFYNVGLSFTDNQGNKRYLEIDKNVRFLRLEVGGNIAFREVSLADDKGNVVLSYFRPFLVNDDTVKFIPAFLRLIPIFIALAIAVTAISALSNYASIKRDILKAQAFANNIIKGSYTNFDQGMSYSDFQGLFTELNRLKDLMQKKEQLKKRMTADFAHELRTPLTTLQSHLEALIDGVWQPSQERFMSCHEEILRLIRLVNDLEKLSKLDDENIILNKTTFDLDELVRSISLNFQGKFKNNNISLKFNSDRQVINADKDKISQVIINLFSNSLKYSPRDGSILVDIRGDEKHVYLVVNDNGSGIPIKDINNVFDRFYRSDSSRTRATGGAGVGLTITRSIIEAHRGSIDIVSQEGLGTEVTVILPRGQVILHSS